MTTNNHPAHGPVSLDRLHQIREILSKAATQSDGGNLCYAMADAVKVIDGAIATFGAEPVAYMRIDGEDVEYNGHNEFSGGGKGVPLYTTPPAPVVDWVPLGDSPYDVPYSMPSNLRELIAEEIGILFSDDDAQSVWNACRAAMLQGAEPASNCDELPLDYLQGHKDGLEWAAQLAKANHPETGDWLYDDPIELSKAIRKGPDMPLSDGNSPVIQDGWIKCSERMPEDEQEVLTRNRMGHCFVSFFDEHSGLFFDRVDVAAACCIEHILVTHWMPLPAAPQQEVKNV
ncbi:DUF551 domain-containing protein [Citrobacter freundii]|uniref:DUF551 domain-containing protein n=1 Tax=Citrobacter freundii TaxID=546 RepID=UPI0015F9EE63|nr:DUF551 domain-containing protein [Citrobacter freundii]MBA8045641.1 DUF551 domain-containing protein [Citrobacter freundii]